MTTSEWPTRCQRSSRRRPGSQQPPQRHPAPNSTHDGKGDPLPLGEPIPTTTIHDVAIDGTFPAAGFEERIHRWARPIAHAQGAPVRE